MDLGALPPEINSGLIYTGPGAAPMTAAATAWSRLAAELNSTAAQYDSVVYSLVGEQWTGPAAESMAAAVQPYVSWMSLTAGQLQHAASQAAASAAAFETAFAMAVPPPLIAANRVQLATLVATNFLGVNTPAVMATEAQYAEMWAQDAAAMYGYAAASASAAALTPPTPPTAVTDPGGSGAQAGAVAQAAAAAGNQSGLTEALSALPSAVAELATPLASVSASDIVTSIDGLLGTPFVSIAVDGVVSAAAWWSMNTIPNAVLAGHTLGADALPEAAAGQTPPAVGSTAAMALVSAVAPPAATGAAVLGRAPVVATFGGAPSLGSLSVPAGWSAAAAPAAAAGAVGSTGSGWVAAAENGSAAVLPAGVPSVATAWKGGIGAPRYGVRPTVMPKTGLI